MQEGKLHPKLSLFQLTQMVVAQERGKTGTFPGVLFLFYWAALNYILLYMSHPELPNSIHRDMAVQNTGLCLMLHRGLCRAQLKF